MRRLRWHTAMMAVICGFITHNAWANPQDRSPDSRPEELLVKARDFLARAQTIQVEMKHAEIATNPRGRMEIQQHFTLAAERPNRINLVTSRSRAKLLMDGEDFTPEKGEVEDEQYRLVCDGAHLYAFMRKDRFTKDPAPPDWGSAFARWDEYAGTLPQATGLAARLFLSDDFPGDADVLVAGKVLGVEQIDGHSTQRLNFTLQPKPDAEPNQSQISVPRPLLVALGVRSAIFDIWIDQSDQPLIRRMRIELVPSVRHEIMADTQSESIITFDNWRLDERVPDDAFALRPPNDAREAIALTSGGSGWPLVGSPLSQFHLELIGGGVFNTSDYKGRILVLVFWNGAELPDNEPVHTMLYDVSQYHDRGVALCLVNARNSEEAIKRFLGQHRWKVPVAKDRDGSVSRPYIGDSHGSTALVIGKDGKIQATYSTYAQDALRLRAELAALVAGKQIIEDEIADEDEDHHP
jgi:hypothetical protein